MDENTFLAEDILGRLVNPESASRDRTRLSKSIVLAIRGLMMQTEPDRLSLDYAAYIVLALEEIYHSIDQSVLAWEKRGYWVKADRFRMDWEWAGIISRKMRSAVNSQDWASIAILSTQIAQKFSTIKIPEKNRLGEPWHGAWDALQQVSK